MHFISFKNHLTQTCGALVCVCVCVLATARPTLSTLTECYVIERMITTTTTIEEKNGPAAQ